MPSYSVNTLNSAAWLVYINGLEIPTMSYTVNFGVWKKATLDIDIVPHPAMFRIGHEDRLQVALFYLDLFYYDTPTFCLMGEFEVKGCSYTNSSAGRAIRLSCVSHMDILSQLNFYYMSSVNDMLTGLGAVTATDPSGVAVPKPYYPASLFLEGLIDVPVGDETGKGTSVNDISADDNAQNISNDNFIKRPIDFVTNVFRALLRPMGKTKEGSSVPNSSAAIPGKNFFARWFNMSQHHKRWAALPIFEDGGNAGCFPIVKAVQDTNTLPVIQQQIGDSVGASGTAWDLIQQVLSYMMMEVLTVPCPASAVTTKVTGVVMPPLPNLTGETPTEIRSIPTFYVKPQCYFAIPPTCNTVFPSMVRNLSYQEDYASQPTRIYLGEQFMSAAIGQANDSQVQPIVNQLLTTAFPVGAKKRMLDLNETKGSNNKNFLLFPEEFFKGPMSQSFNAPPFLYLLQQSENAKSAVDYDVTKKVEREGIATALDYVPDAVANAVGGVIDSAVSGTVRDTVGEFVNISQENLTGESVNTVTVNESFSGMNTTPLGDLFDKYAEYEYFRARYAARNGSLSTEHNPYLVPGFPCVVFDRRPTSIDVMAYVLDVTHSGVASNPPSLSTVASLSFVRSMNEFVQNLGGYDVSPVEPLPEIRDIVQKMDKAHEFYSRMFYGTRPRNVSAAFNWRAEMDLVNENGDKIDVSKVDEFSQLEARPKFSALFNSYDASMRYVARPACTLKEYVEIWHGKKIEELIKSGVVQGQYNSHYAMEADPSKTKGAVFWGRIFKLVQGPGKIPPVEASNIGPAPDYAAAGPAANIPVDKSQGMPETRKDWDSILERYRKIVRSEGIIAPQR